MIDLQRITRGSGILTLVLLIAALLYRSVWTSYFDDGQVFTHLPATLLLAKHWRLGGFDT